MLAIAHAASVGGIATLVGTPPNLAFTRIYEINFGEAVSFGEWFLFALPTAMLLFFGVWLVLMRVHFRRSKIDFEASDITANALQKMGSFTPEEKKVAAVFITMAALWIFRKDLNFGLFSIPGWGSLFAPRKFHQ